MALRHITYGYTMSDGTYRIEENEAKIVCRIFDEYLSGKTLTDIAAELTQESVHYTEERSDWNKNIIARIIENDKYIGNDMYPAIVAKEIFQKARAEKAEKGAHKLCGSEEIEYLRNITVCGQCGGRMRRIGKWKSREKWICANGCKTESYIDDNSLLTQIRLVTDRGKSQPNLFCRKSKAEVFIPSIEVTKAENEINRILESNDFTFATAKQAILEEARMKFMCCKDDPMESLTDSLIEFVQRNAGITTEYLKKAVKKVIAMKDGSIYIEFVNGATLSGKEETEWQR